MESNVSFLFLEGERVRLWPWPGSLQQVETEARHPHTSGGRSKAHQLTGQDVSTSPLQGESCVHLSFSGSELPSQAVSSLRSALLCVKLTAWFSSSATYLLCDFGQVTSSISSSVKWRFAYWKVTAESGGWKLSNTHSSLSQVWGIVDA